MESFARESNEFVPVVATLNGVPATSGQVQLAVHLTGDRPTAWAAPTVIASEYGVMTGGRDLGFYTVWAMVTANPETPVIECGQFRIY